MTLITARLPHLTIRFVDAAWLSESELATATFCWVLDADTPATCVHVALQSGLPLLVPAVRDDLKSLCQTGNCGSSYQSPTEAADWIVEILRSPLMRNALSDCARLASANRHFTADAQ